MQRNKFSRYFSSIVAGLIVGGTCGYVLIEGWTVLDSLYMTIITLSTVGYGETRELSEVGRVFTTILIALSVVGMACWTAGVTSIIVSGELTGAFALQREKKMIQSLKKHAIVCGGGMFARTAIDQLLREDKEVVAIVNSQDEIALIRRLYPDLPVVDGDPKSELVLADANLLNAKHVIAATDSDYDNLLVTITARGVDKDIFVICCAHQSEIASRMYKVGANEVVCPFVLGGERAAKLVA